MVVGFLITDPVLKLITEPIQQVAESRGDAGSVELMFSTVTSGFDLKLRMSFAIGLLISAPFWMWQIWAFIMPGLTRKEIRYTVGFLAAAIPLFFAGCWAGLVVMPHIVELMASFVPAGRRPSTTRRTTTTSSSSCCSSSASPSFCRSSSSR